MMFPPRAMSGLPGQVAEMAAVGLARVAGVGPGTSQLTIFFAATTTTGGEPGNDGQGHRSRMARNP